MSVSTIQGNVCAPTNMGKSLPLYYKLCAKKYMLQLIETK